MTRLSRKIRSDLLTDVDQLNGNNLTNNQRHLSVLKEYSHFLPDVDSPDTYGHVIDQHKPLFIDVKRISEIRGVGFLQVFCCLWDNCAFIVFIVFNYYNLKKLCVIFRII